MRISATGNKVPQARCFHPRAGGDPGAPASAGTRVPCGTRGFTLIELLIVLTIVGLMSAAVVVAMPDSRGSLRGEAERLAARAKAAQDRAVIDARPMALRVSAGAYAIERRADDAWQEDISYSLSEGTQAQVGKEGSTRIVFDPTGVVEPSQIFLRREGEQASVVISQNGRIAIDG